METGRALSGARARRERHEPAAHLRRHAPRVRRAQGAGPAGGAGILPDAHREHRRLRAAHRRRHRAARSCRCTAAWRTSATAAPRRWRPTTSARPTTTCSASWGLRLGQADAWPEGDAGRCVRRPAGARRHGLGHVLRQLGIYYRPPAFAKHEMPGPDGSAPGLRHHDGQDRAGERVPGRAGRPAPARAAAARHASARRSSRQRVEAEGRRVPDDDHRLAQAAVQRVHVLQQPCLPRRRRRCRWPR